MDCVEILKEIKELIFNVESKIEGKHRDEFDKLYDLLEDLEERNREREMQSESASSSDGRLRRMEEALKASEEHLRLVVTNANALIFIIDNDGIITLSEGKALNLFKIHPNQIVGISIFDIYDDIPKVKEDIREALSGQMVNSILNIQDYTFETVYSPIKDPKGNVHGIVAIAIDITERIKLGREKENLIRDLQLSNEKIYDDANRLIRLNDDLIVSEEKLKKTNEEKDKFISIISHDLRSPFAGILGISEGLLDYYDHLSEAEIKNRIELLNSTSQNLLKLLENLLVWAKANRDKATVNKVKIPLYKTVQANIELLINNAIEKRITINNAVQRNVSVFADEGMLNTVLRNLISNAIKFTNLGGEINLGTNCAFEKNRTEIYVCDNGVGIPTDIVENLFNINRQYTSLGTNKEKGTGLGLLICKEMIEKQNGRIWVESKLGEGTCFKFELNSVIEDNGFYEDEVNIIKRTEKLRSKLFQINKDYLSNKRFEDLALMINDLEENFIEKCAELSETLILGDIAKFAKDLKDISQKYDCENLSSYADNMLEKLKMMDIVQLNNYLDYFPVLVNDIKNIVSEAE